jgi:hypothetical protein
VSGLIFGVNSCYYLGEIGMLRKLKSATTLITLVIVMFVGAMLITAGPVQADHCSSKEETKKCDKDKKEEGKGEEKKGCDKAESSDSEEEKAEDKGTE